MLSDINSEHKHEYKCERVLNGEQSLPQVCATKLASDFSLIVVL